MEQPSSAKFTGFRSLKTPDRAHEFEPLRVEGILPRDLQGCLYRVGPGTFESFGKRHAHWFDGEGLIAAVRINESGAWGACRLVDCGLDQEHQAGHPILARFGAAAPKITTRIRSMWDSRAGANLANTALFEWQHRLFALYEASHPTEIDPKTLETLGPTDLGGVVRYSFTAHPKYVPTRRAHYAFGFRPLPIPSLDLYCLPDEGPARYLGAVRYNASAFVHDFAVVDDAIVFICSPIFSNPFNVIVKGESFDASLRFSPEKGCEVIVVPLDDVTQAWRKKIEGLLAVHVVNAFRSENKIVVDYMASTSAIGMEWIRSVMSGVLTPNGQDQSVYRMEIETDSKSIRNHKRLELHGEFPTIAPAAVNTHYEWTYFAGFREDVKDACDFYSALFKVHVPTGNAQRWDCDKGHTTTEAIFVPRARPRAEDDGYLLSMVYDSHRDRSYLQVLDAWGDELKPMCRLHFDYPIPYTFHGIFVDRIF